MKLTVKTTQGKVFQVDVENTDTVANLKQKIQDTQNHPVGVQKIIYSGKILPDDKTVESCAFKEKDFLVLMVSKPKPTPTPMPSTSTAASIPAAAPPPTAAATSTTPAAAPASVTGSAAAETTTPASAAPQAAAAATAPSTTTSASAQATFGDSFLSGAALQTTIDNMTEMGFPRDQVLRALRASFNNPDRAVEYLMNGIPAHLEAEAASAAPRASAAAQGTPTTTSQPAAANPPSSTTPAAAPSNQPQNLFQLAQQQQQQQQQQVQGAGGGGVPGLGGLPIDIEALRQSPAIQQLRELMAQNPALIQPLIQQLAQQNPTLATAIGQNPELLMQLLGGEGGVDFSQLGSEGAEGGIPPGAQVLSVTPEERAAIERLESLGFPRHQVIEAYFACDKNEELAANYLFEGGFEEDD